MQEPEPNAPEPLPPPGGVAPEPEPVPERPKGFRGPAKDPLAQIADALREITPVLDAADMEPDPERTDWSRSRGQLDAAYSLFKGDVLSAIDEAFATMPSGSELRLKVAGNVAWIGAELAALLWASKRTDDAQRLLLQVASFAPVSGPDGANVKAEIDAAIADTAPWVELMRARYLQRSRQWDEGDRVLRAAKGKATNAVIRAAIQKQLGGARPITSVPPLFRINGCGASIYGERDRRPDGSYVTTYCVALLFIPVWPISAYRVIDNGNGSYSFLAREPVSAFARGYRWVVSGLVGLWLAGLAISGYLNDPHRLATNAFADTRARTASMAPDAALSAWESLASSHGYSLSSSDRETAGTEMTRLVLAGVASPMTVERVGEVETALSRYRALPELAHGSAQEAMVLERVLAWQSDVGSAGQEQALASMRVLDALTAEDAPSSELETTMRDVDRLLYGGRGRTSAFATSSEVAERRAGLHRVLAEAVASEWPLEAIDHWSEAGDPASMERLGVTLADLSSSRSLLLECAPAVDRYLAATPAGSEPHDAIALAMEQARRMRDDEGRRLALASGEPAALNAVLDTYPGDQESIAALAQSKRQSGDLAGAHALLDPLGPPGHLASAAQVARASLLADEGHLEEAVALLSHHVAAGLPAFQSAQRAYSAAFDARTRELEAQLRSPYPPMELERRLAGVTDDEEGRGIVQRWFLEQVDGDANLASLRQTMEASSAVVPGVLQLAMYELRLGNDSSGEVRDRHFREAERLFLAIREQAEGLPSFHLGLGQVYHRLGRTAEGDAEIAQVLAMGQPALELEAAHTYRDLGLTSQASEIAERVWSSGVAPHAESAAMLMSLLVHTLEDEELWLSRADQDSSFVQINLLQARARREARDGNLREAERLFGQVADRNLAMSAHDEAALNNAAIALQQRYACSGNPAHLSRAVDLMEQSLRRAPESGITAANLAELEEYAGYVAVLDRTMHTRELHLDASDASDLVRWLLSGEQHDTVVAALREEPRLGRALEAARQAQALSPQRTTPYETELEILRQVDDAAAIASLLERIGRVTNLETASREAETQRWARGELDETLRPTLERAVETARERAESLRDGHAPTYAAALVLLARRLEDRAQMTRAPADYEEAERALADAETAAPGLGSRTSRGWSAITHALLTLAGSNAAARAIVDAGWRTTSVGILCARLSADPSARDAAARSPELREAVALLRGSRRHGPQSLACATLAADEALIAEASEPARAEASRHALLVDAALSPSSGFAELSR